MRKMAPDKGDAFADGTVGVLFQPSQQRPPLFPNGPLLTTQRLGKGRRGLASSAAGSRHP